MKRYAWLTDIHLEFLGDKETAAFMKDLAAQKLDGLFITGDISTALQIEAHLQLFEDLYQSPVYFVLGTTIIMVVPLKQFEKWLKQSATNLNGSIGCQCRVLLHLGNLPDWS